MNADHNVRISDTPDATKTAADGWAASPASVEETQTYHKYTNHSVESDVAIAGGIDNVFVTGKNVDVYIGVTLNGVFGYGATLIKNVPKPVSIYAMATFVTREGALCGFGWITPDGSIAAPPNLPAGTFYIVAHYTTY